MNKRSLLKSLGLQFIITNVIILNSMLNNAVKEPSWQISLISGFIGISCFMWVYKED